MAEDPLTWNNPYGIDASIGDNHAQPTSANLEALQFQLSDFQSDVQNWPLFPAGNVFQEGNTAPNGTHYGSSEDFSFPVKNESASSVSTPSFGKIASPQEVAPRVAKAKRPAKSKKPLLDELEAELMEKDDEYLTEEQIAIKRKAQNRLAQRAFRERKEMKLKELEQKLLQSEDERQKLLEKLDDIKSKYISIQTENSLLRSTGEPHAGGAQMNESRFDFPQSQKEFISKMVQGKGHEINPTTVNKVYDEPQNPGRKVLAIGAVWDYLQIKREEEEYENVDLVEAMQLLKGNEVCHGFGPAYPLDLVESVLRQLAN